MTKLTKRTIDASLPQDKEYLIWDSEIKGFGCRIYPSGIKTYVFFYRHPQTRKKIGLKIGKHGNVTPDVAREIAQGWAGDVARGIDPKDQQKEEGKDSKNIYFQQFLDIFTERYRKIYHKKRTFKEQTYLIDNHLLPFFKNKKINDITRQDILKFKDHLSHFSVTCNRALSMLSCIFNKAIFWEYRNGYNPCHGVGKHKEKKLERFLNSQELSCLNEALNSQEALRLTNPYVIPAIRMLIYTGCRKNEILTLKWEDVHLEKDHIHLKDSKTGEKIVPLNKFSKSVLESLKKQSDNPYVFCGEKAGSHLTDIKKTWYKIRSMIDLKDVRIHDLRHTFASIAIEAELDLYKVSKLLGHKDIRTTMRYAHIAKTSLVKNAKSMESAFESVSA